MPGRDEIVAKVTSEASASSVGALAAYLQRSCGHVSLDERVIAQGYRFYPWMSDEIPQFFNKRFTTGSTNLAITLQGGVDLDGEDPFDGCVTTSDARAIIETPGFEATLWVARVTVGTRMFDVTEIADPTFIAQHPSEFRLLADELISLGIHDGTACELCTHQAFESESEAA